jgi:iron complex transport system substrate-binding protein
MREKIGLLLAVCLLLAGCGQTTAETTATAETAPEAMTEQETAVEATPEAAESEAEAKTVTFTDDLGREVTVSDPQRVAALIGSFAQTWCLAGGQDTLVAAADDTWTSFDLDLDEDVVNLGGVKEISLETLIGAEPDFVIASCNTDIDLELEESLTAMGIPVAYFQVDAFSDYLHMLSILTDITGRADLYDQYGQQQEEAIEGAKALADGTQPTVLYIRATGSSVKAKNSSGTVLGEMLADLDTINVADGENDLLDNLSLEAILAADPDYIFLVYQGSDPSGAEALMDELLLSNPAWATLRAVEEGRCYTMDSSLYNLKPNDRWALAYEGLANILYGD